MIQSLVTQLSEAEQHALKLKKAQIGVNPQGLEEVLRTLSQKAPQSFNECCQGDLECVLIDLWTQTQQYESLILSLIEDDSPIKAI